ncbi:7TMR-DISMED2 domain-containing protein [Azospirillum thermophilum]|uniref:Diguanylate cyclase n=1 Tax=Azospirillum thermophilum TaxID=2202148 RepID=A0A2S2CSR3_9PROT|nr:7TM-DISM domain-containing protein [Azospirillum thermophilum]AWK87563.1 hypothetical protein DEW08_16245 [Azospirillum thermophilum]
MACGVRDVRWLAVLLVSLWLGVAAPAAAGSAAGADAGTAAGTVRLTAGLAQASLSGHLGRLVDPGGALTLEDAVAADAAGAFQPLPTFVGAGHTADVHWYRVLLEREPGAPAEWVVELGEAYIDHIDLFVVDPAAADGRPGEGRDIVRFALGDHVPFSRRPMGTRLHSVLLSLPEGRPVTVYLRVETISAMMLSGRVWAPAAFIGHETSALLLHGLFFGVLAVLILLYLALATALEDGTLVAYAGFVATLFFYYLGANGIAAVWLPDLPGWALNLLTGGNGLLGVSAAIVMWDRILNLRQTFPRVHRVYMVLAVLGC